MSILDRIVETKKAEVARMSAVASAFRAPRKSFVEAIQRGKPAIIAEVKPKSPSAGELIAIDRVPQLVEIYDRLASAISVLCDETYFGGGYDLLAQAASLTGRPLLAKEFVIDRKQVVMASSLGASAVLLVAAILDESALTALIRDAVGHDCDVLLELHDEDDLSKAAAVVAALGATERQRIVLGINNRNLDSLEIDLRTTERLAPLVRERLGGDRPLVAESGIDSPEACRRLAPWVDGFLVGTCLLRSSEPEELLRSLVHACDHA